MSERERARLSIQHLFARWVEALAFAELPEEVIENAKVAIADSLAIAVVGASRSRSNSYTLPLLGNASTNGEASVLLQEGRTSIVSAAMLNSIYAHSCEMDDTSTAGGHPGSVMVPTALAVAEGRHLNGRDVILGVVAGYEIMYRSSLPTFPVSTNRGIQSTGKDCCFGATATVGKLLKMKQAELSEAFGVTGNYCCGLMEYDQSGGESKRLFAGLAARAGVEATAFAEAGLTGPKKIWEGKKGVWAVFGGSFDSSLATDELGKRFCIVSERVIKLYSAVASAVIFALSQLVGTTVFRSADIRRIIIEKGGDPSHGGGAMTGGSPPSNALAAQFNVAFSCALRVLFHRNDLEVYEDDRLWSDPEVLDLCSKVSIQQLPPEVSKGGPTGTVIATMELMDGTVRTIRIDAPPGVPSNPLTLKDYEQRFFEFMEQAEVSESVAADVYDQLRKIEDLATIDGIMAPLRSKEVQ